MTTAARMTRADSHREFARIYRDRAESARHYLDSPDPAETRWAQESADAYEQLAEIEDRYADALVQR